MLSAVTMATGSKVAPAAANKDNHSLTACVITASVSLARFGPSHKLLVQDLQKFKSGGDAAAAEEGKVVRFYITPFVVSACVVCGCASHEPIGRCDPGSVGTYSPVTGALLFDRKPGALPASFYAARSDWPAVTRGTWTGEVAVYDVRIYDRQAGDWPFYGSGLDYYRRTFRSHRSGAFYR
jgi:hypothetical protein